MLVHEHRTRKQTFVVEMDDSQTRYAAPPPRDDDVCIVELVELDKVEVSEFLHCVVPIEGVSLGGDRGRDMLQGSQAREGSVRGR